MEIVLVPSPAFEPIARCERPENDEDKSITQPLVRSIWNGRCINVFRLLEYEPEPIRPPEFAAYCKGLTFSPAKRTGW